MGMIFSSRRRPQRKGSGATQQLEPVLPITDTISQDPAPSSRDRQRSGILHRLPLDLLHCIFDHLDPAGSIALALSCKATYHCFFRRALGRMRDPSTTRLQVQVVHLLLEKDCGHDSYFCSACADFHSFSPQWRATDHNLVYRLHGPKFTNRKTWASFESTLGYDGPNQYYMRFLMPSHVWS